MPVADDADAFGVARDDDAELPARAVAREVQVALVAGDDLFVGLGAAELVHELGRVRPPKQVEIVDRIRPQGHLGHAPIRPRPADTGYRVAAAD